MEVTPPEGTFPTTPPASCMCYSSLSKSPFVPSSRIWGSGRFQVLWMLVPLLPAIVEPVAQGGVQARMAKGSMWGKPARGKIDT